MGSKSLGKGGMQKGGMNLGLPVGDNYRCARGGVPRSAQPRSGVANAARVSQGSEHDVWSGLSVKDPERHSSEHVTITVVVYNTVADGVPSIEDVAAAVDDLEALYAACSAEG